MTNKRLIFMLTCLIAGCSTPVPNSQKNKDEVARRLEDKKTTGKVPVKTASSSLTGYQQELALRISEANANRVYTDRPQALLRSVIVLNFMINAEGKLLHSEVLRTNRDKTTEKIALASLSNASPFPKPPSHLLRSDKLKITETWLFNNDGRFQLRTIALPQMEE